MRRIHIMLYCVALLYKHRGRLMHVVASQTSFRVRFIVGCTQRTSHDPSTPLSSKRANTTVCGASIKLCGGDATIVSVLSSRHTSIHSEPRILGYCSTGLLRRFRGAAIVSAIPAVQWSSDNWLHKVATGSHARARPVPYRVLRRWIHSRGLLHCHVQCISGNSVEFLLSVAA
jgi:hypothetical protein